MTAVAWDDGLRWHVEQIEKPAEDPLSVAFVRDKHLKLTNGTVEDDYLLRLIKTSTRQGERFTRRAWIEQTWAQVQSGFPCWHIELGKPPLIAVESIEYTDENGVEQTLAPSLYQVSATRDENRRAVIAPAPDESWPSTKTGLLEAVTITFRCGYVDGGSPAKPDVPEDLLHGQLVYIGECYKQRSDSVIGFGTSIDPAVVRARDLWLGYRVF